MAVSAVLLLENAQGHGIHVGGAKEKIFTRSHHQWSIKCTTREGHTFGS